MWDGLARAVGQLSDPVFLRVLAKTLALSLVITGLIAAAAIWAFTGVDLAAQPAWLQWAADALAVLMGLFGAYLLFGLVSAAVIGLFLDEVAAAVERRHYPADAPGRELPFARAALYALRFLLVVLVVNLVAAPFYLAALFIAGLGLVLGLLVNGYLLGREFFELSALRHLPDQRARLLRKRYAGRIYLAGAVMALGLSLPLANLLTPLIGTAWMVHIFKALHRDPQTVT